MSDSTAVAEYSDRLCVVDAGATGGLGLEWQPFFPMLRPVLFESSPGQIERLRARFPFGSILQSRLSDRDEPIELYVTRNHKCISPLEPNTELLQPYRAGWAFEVTGHETVRASRYDTLYAEGRVPRPDAVRLKMQGYEYQVLMGFGDLLEGCLALKIGLNFAPIYKGQHEAADVIAMLARRGFVMRHLIPSPNFEGDLIETEAVFSRDARGRRSLSSSDRRKLDIALTGFGDPNARVPVMPARQRGSRPRLLVAHNTRQHFEVMVALWSDLRDTYDVLCWSMAPETRGRIAFMEKLGIKRWSAGDEVDQVIVATMEQPVTDELIRAAIETSPTLGVVHRVNLVTGPDRVGLYPRLKDHLVLCNIGGGDAPSPFTSPSSDRTGFLVQGSLERRRDYGGVDMLARECPSEPFRVVGSQNPAVDVAGELQADNIHIHANLPELRFYEVCGSCRFILPMLDPQRFRPYFTDRFTSTVLIGLALDIPFIAHRALFDLYPIKGFMYDTPEELVELVRQAATLPLDEYETIRNEQVASRRALSRHNVETVQRLLANIAAADRSKTAVGAI